MDIFAEGNKKCLEIKGKIPKSSKHLIWGRPFEQLRTCVGFENAIISLSLDEIDSQYCVPPSTIGLDVRMFSVGI